jgi:hypothetical protein
MRTNLRKLGGIAKAMGFGLALLPLVCSLSLAQQQETKPTPKLPLSRETTYFSGPLDKDGYVDYASALNAYFGQGIKPEDNAYVALITAVGPSPQSGPPLPESFFQALGIDPLPVDGDYFLSVTGYLANKFQLPIEALVQADDQLRKAWRYPWQADDYPLVMVWLRDYENLLNRLSLELQRPRYFRPLIPNLTLFEQPLPDVQAFRELAYAYLARAMLRTRHGLYRLAWDDLLTVKRVGRMMRQGPTIIEVLAGSALESLAGSALNVYIGTASLDGDTWMRYQQQWRNVASLSTWRTSLAFKSRAEVLDLVQLVHRGRFLDQTSSLAALGFPALTTEFEHRLLLNGLDWEELLRTVNRWFDRCEECLKEPDLAAFKKRLDQLETELGQAAKRVNVLGQQLRWPLIMAYVLAGKKRTAARCWAVNLAHQTSQLWQRISTSLSRTEEMDRLLDVAFALARYHDQTGKYPDRLEQLVPGFLPRIEPDLFSGKPPIYRRTGKGYVLYSVGPNGTDDNGRSFEDEPRGDDIVLRMPPAPPR